MGYGEAVVLVTLSLTFEYFSAHFILLNFLDDSIEVGALGGVFVEAHPHELEKQEVAVFWYLDLYN